jgi:phage baseplate assembly protein W
MTGAMRMSSGREAPASFLGTGWSFPPAFTAGGAEVDMVSGAQDIHQALEILLATRIGERPMQESFGCNLDEALFEEVDQALVNRITSAISDAILRHEPRIALRDLDIEQSDADPGVLRIRLEYAVLGTNSRYNMVFPFYLNEAITPGP